MTTTAFASALAAGSSGVWAGQRALLLLHALGGAQELHPAPCRRRAPPCGPRRMATAAAAAAAAGDHQQQNTSTNTPPERRMPAIARPLVPSQALRELVSDQAQPRSQIIKALSDYAKKNGLQDPDDKKLVHCDAKLKALLGVDECTFLGMSKYLSPHLRKPEEVGGKYLEQAQTYEENWVRDNADKLQKAADRKGTSKRRGPVSSDQARASGTGLWKPVQLSPDLAKVCGGRAELPRQEILKYVWTYIRDNNLQGKPGQAIHCDALLKSVFGSETVTARSIMGGIQPHISK
jgi:chromatin remodeling complex protein RSC6